MFIENILVR